MSSNFKIVIPNKIFIKDPESSELGKRIVQHGILLIDDIGFEAFTFKKLGLRIGSNESSIYRYFENKHNLLLYLTSWYWAWREHQLVMETFSISNAEDKLKKGIEILTRTVTVDTNFSHVNEIVLNKIVINENSKSFLTKEVDKENKDGFFSPYKQVVFRLKEMIQSVNSSYDYPTSLASTIIEGGLHQHFLKGHFTSITDCSNTTSPTQFFKSLALQALKR